LVKITVTDDVKKLEQAEYVVCNRASLPSIFDDDVFNICCECGQKVRERPYNPVGPKRICTECLPILQVLQDTEATILTTDQQMKEVRDGLAKDDEP